MSRFSRMLSAIGGLAQRAGATCSVCLGAHDEEIHAATLEVRHWFRTEVTKGLDMEGAPQ